MDRTVYSFLKIYPGFPGRDEGLDLKRLKGHFYRKPNSNNV